MASELNIGRETEAVHERLVKALDRIRELEVELSDAEEWIDTLEIALERTRDLEKKQCEKCLCFMRDGCEITCRACDKLCCGDYCAERCERCWAPFCCNECLVAHQTEEKQCQEWRTCTCIII